MDKERIAETLRALRGDERREVVAVAVGVTAQAIANYESGQRIPSDAVKIKLAEYYHRTVQEIFYA